MKSLPPKSSSRSLLTAVLIIVAVIIYAYGFQVTQVNLAETAKPQRQIQLVRILRAIAQPDILNYEQEIVSVNAPLQVPCLNGPTGPVTVGSGPSLTLSQGCAAGQSEITVTGSGFPPDGEVSVRFVPTSQVPLPAARVQSDATGGFTTSFTVPKNREADTPQGIQAETKANTGRPYLSRTAKETWSKIIETIFMALLATTQGTALAFPISFLAASNLMRGVTAPFTAIILSLLTLPIGFYLGSLVGGFWGTFGLTMGATSNTLGVGGLVVIVPVMVFALRFGIGGAEERQVTGLDRVLRLGGMVVAGIALFVNLGLLAMVCEKLGAFLSTRIGGLGFLGLFLFNLASILELLLPLIGAFGGILVVSSLTAPLGRKVLPALPLAPRKLIAVMLSAATGALYVGLAGAGVGWLYQLDNPVGYLWLPAAAGAILGLLLGLRMDVATPTPIGLTVYFIMRTVLNTLRAIEPLIMVIVFAVWVGIGPFAGVLALCLHTIAALGKLYSEQVENILPGPLEAITATGATRLQTIVYAVIPQIVPPYIAFTLYRWDINVRMSTIIGFAGGGGIGFLLQQNINLLQYRQASVQMIAIAIVVGTLDYVSAAIRERVV